MLVVGTQTHCVCHSNLKYGRYSQDPNKADFVRALKLQLASYFPNNIVTAVT